MKKTTPDRIDPEMKAKQADGPPPHIKVKNEVRTLTIDELAQIIHKSVASIRSDMSRHPERLPRWWKCPGGAKRPLWLVSTVEAFIEQHAARCGASDEDAKS